MRGVTSQDIGPLWNGFHRARHVPSTLADIAIKWENLDAGTRDDALRFYNEILAKFGGRSPVEVRHAERCAWNECMQFVHDEAKVPSLQAFARECDRQYPGIKVSTRKTVKLSSGLWWYDPDEPTGMVWKHIYDENLPAYVPSNAPTCLTAEDFAACAALLRGES